MRYTFAVFCALGMIFVGGMMDVYLTVEIVKGNEWIRPLTIGEYIAWTLFATAGAIGYWYLLRPFGKGKGRCVLCGGELKKH